MSNSKNLSDPGELGGKRRFLGWLLFWGYSLIILKGAIMPPEEIPPVFEWLNDKVVHGAEYFLLFLIGVNAFERARTLRLRKNAMLYAVFYGLLMGALTEIIQLGARGRSSDALDWLADAAGIFLALFTCKMLTNLRRTGEQE